MELEISVECINCAFILVFDDKSSEIRDQRFLLRELLTPQVDVVVDVKKGTRQTVLAPARLLLLLLSISCLPAFLYVCVCVCVCVFEWVLNVWFLGFSYNCAHTGSHPLYTKQLWKQLVCVCVFVCVCVCLWQGIESDRMKRETKGEGNLCDMWWKQRPRPGPKRQIDKERGGKKREDGGEIKEGGFRPGPRYATMHPPSLSQTPHTSTFVFPVPCFCLRPPFLPLFLVSSYGKWMLSFSCPFPFSVSLSLSLSFLFLPSSLDSLPEAADLRDTVFLKLSPVWKQWSSVLVSVRWVKSHSFIHPRGRLNMHCICYRMFAGSTPLVCMLRCLWARNSTPVRWSAPCMAATSISATCPTVVNIYCLGYLKLVCIVFPWRTIYDFLLPDQWRGWKWFGARCNDARS